MLLRRLAERSPLRQDVLSLEFTLRVELLRHVPLFLDAEVAADQIEIITERRPQLLSRPDVEGAFRVFRTAVRDETVRVFGREKTARWAGELPGHVVEDIAGQPREALITGCLSRLHAVHRD